MPEDFAVGADQRLVDEIKETPFNWPGGGPLEVGGNSSADVGLARPINVIEQFDEALTTHFG